MEVEDREEQDLVLLTEVPYATQPEEPLTPSPAKSTASTKDVSFESSSTTEHTHNNDPAALDFLAFIDNDNNTSIDDEEAIPKVAPGEPLVEVQPGIIQKIEAAEKNGAVDSEKARRSRKRKLIAGIVVLLLLIIIGIVVGVGVAMGTMKNNDSGTINAFTETTTTTTDAPSVQQESSTPSGAPTIDPFLDIASRLFLIPSRFPTNESSPEYKAVQFLAGEDDQNRDISKLGQRYSLVNLFYATGGPEWDDPLNFLSTDLHECDWNTLTDSSLIKGVVCENDDLSVTYLSIPNNNLVGTLPQHIGFLPRIQHLDLSFNRIGGIIPQGLVASSGSLKRLSLNNNQLTGSIPSFLFQSSFSKLSYFSVEHNFLTGDLDQLCTAADADGENNVNKAMAADCLGTDPEITCSCCRYCCDREDSCERMEIN